MRVKEYLQDNILIFDGAMGTYYAALMNDMSSNCEAANIDNPILERLKFSMIYDM